MRESKFLLDSGDPDEYRQIVSLTEEKGKTLWGSTTNPSLVAKKLAGKHLTKEEAFKLQKGLVMEILDIVPGAVSAEVYADMNTNAEDMADQGRDIATWHERVYVKLPTTLEGFKARTILRKEGVPINNTLVFSQEQIFAICLHEEIIQKQFSPKKNLWPCFISPFVGRLDDIGIDGMQLVANGMKVKSMFETELWMLEASVRRLEHIERGFESGSELMTIPAKIFTEYFEKQSTTDSIDLLSYAKDLSPIQQWNDPKGLKSITTIEGFMEALSSGQLDIHHELTDKGIERFVTDWQAILTS